MKYKKRLGFIHVSLVLACVASTWWQFQLQFLRGTTSRSLASYSSQRWTASSLTTAVNASRLHFVVIAPSFSFSETLGCGGCTVLLQLREELLGLGHEVDLHSMYVPHNCTNIRANESIVVYPEVVSWTCSGDPLLHVRWMLAPAGTNMPHSTTDSWGQSDWVYNYGTYAPGINKSVPHENILMVIRNPYDGDDFDELAKRQPKVDEREWCFTKRKMAKFHDPNLVIDIHPKEAAELPGDVNSAAELFRHTKYFVSYDPYTMLTFIAPWLGCISIVYPMAGTSKVQWFESTAWGPYFRDTGRTIIMDSIAYGSATDEIERAKSNLHLSREEFMNVKSWGTSTVKRICDDVHAYMAGKPDEIVGRQPVSYFYPTGWYSAN